MKGYGGEMTDLARKFKKMFADGEQPHYELTVRWAWENGDVETSVAGIDASVFENYDLILYLVSYLKHHKSDSDVCDWYWFDGESDVAWYALEGSVPKSQTRHEDCPKGELTKVEYVVGKTRVGVDVPEWNTLFDNEDDKREKMEDAVSDWYSEELD